ASLSISQFADRWHADVQNPVLPVDLLAQTIHALAGLPRDLRIANPFRSTVSSFLQLRHYFGRQSSVDGFHSGIVARNRASCNGGIPSRDPLAGSAVESPPPPPTNPDVPN